MIKFGRRSWCFDLKSVTSGPSWHTWTLINMENNYHYNLFAFVGIQVIPSPPFLKASQPRFSLHLHHITILNLHTRLTYYIRFRLCSIDIGENNIEFRSNRIRHARGRRQQPRACNPTTSQFHTPFFTLYLRMWTTKESRCLPNTHLFFFMVTDW